MPRSCAQLSYVSISSLASSASPRSAKEPSQRQRRVDLVPVELCGAEHFQAPAQGGLGLLFASLGGANHAQRLLDFRDGRYVVFPNRSDGTTISSSAVGRSPISSAARARIPDNSLRFHLSPLAWLSSSARSRHSAASAGRCWYMWSSARCRRAPT